MLVNSVLEGLGVIVIGGQYFQGIVVQIYPAGGNEVLALLRVTPAENVQVEFSEDR